jgi:hypothetical protein
MEQEYKAVKDYQTNKDYDIDEPINFIELANILKNVIESPYDNQELTELILKYFNIFNKNVVLIGARTTLKNELKITPKEALNYLMSLPLNFNLEPFVRLFNNADRFHVISDKDKQHIDRLKLNFEKKGLISQNFESCTHIDVQEFLAWAENKGFIEKNPDDYSNVL